MGHPALKYHVSMEEYLAMEEAASFRSEYYEGEILAMSGGTAAHARIGRNLLATLHATLAARDCEVFGSDMKVKIAAASAIVYPDVSVVCGKDDLPENDALFTDRPILVAEVLSPSTASFDFGKKRRIYAALPSLKVYLVVDQSLPVVEVFSKQANGTWDSETIEGLDVVLNIPVLQVSIPMADLFRNVAFPEAPVP